MPLKPQKVPNEPAAILIRRARSLGCDRLTITIEPDGAFLIADPARPEDWARSDSLIAGLRSFLVLLARRHNA